MDLKNVNHQVQEKKKQKQSMSRPKKRYHGYQTIQNQMIEWQEQLANWRKKTKKVDFLKNLWTGQSNGNVALVSVMLIILKLWKTINCP